VAGVYTQRLRFWRHDVIGRTIDRLSLTLKAARRNVASVDPANEGQFQLARATAAYYEKELAHFVRLKHPNK
jgi:uncharacterized lipoprotein YddW (UPF0748 family)